MKDPNVIAQKMVTRAAQAQPDYIAGVKAVTDSPTALAAKSLDKAAAKYLEAIQSGKTARKLNAVTLADWQTATVNKGGQRFAQGVQAALPKIQKFMAQLLPYQDSYLPALRAMPSTTLADGIQRMIVNAQKMADFKPNT